MMKIDRILFTIRIFYRPRFILYTLMLSYTLLYWIHISHSNLYQIFSHAILNSITLYNILYIGFMVSIFNIRHIENRVFHNVLSNLLSARKIYFEWILVNTLIPVSLGVGTVIMDYTLFVYVKPDFSNLLISFSLFFLISIAYSELFLMMGITFRNSIITFIVTFLIYQFILTPQLDIPYVSFSYINKAYESILSNFNWEVIVGNILPIYLFYFIWVLILSIVIFYGLTRWVEYD